MLDSHQLAELTARFLQQGGQIEKHEIIVRELPQKSLWEVNSIDNDAHNFAIKECRKKRGHSYKQRNKALAVMEKHENLAIKEIVELSGVSENTVREAVKYSGYKVRMLASARPPVGKNHIIEVANEDLTATEIAEKTGCSKARVYRVCKTAGIKIKSERNQETDLERAILSIKTWAYTAKEIADRMGCSEPHVRVVCKKYNRKLKSGVKNYD